MKGEKNTKTPGTLDFGSHRLDRSTGQLVDSEGNPVHLRRQSQDVLAVLADRPGEVVPRDEITERVWPDIATTDDSLIQCIADIRRTLGRDAIQTFPKRGYMLRAAPMPARPRRRVLALVAAGLAIALVGAVLVLRSDPVPVHQAQADQQVVPPPVSADLTLAVLPFVHLGDDAGLRFFSDGLSEDLTTDLSKVPGLTVISHLSSFDFRDAEKGFRAIAADLGVRYLVRGTVRHEGDRVRVNVSLVDPAGGFNVWAERFDLDRGRPFGIQAQVLDQIVAALELDAGHPEPQPRAVAADAYYMLLRGQESLRQLTPRDNLEARAYFRRALDIDPNYARAHAGIAVTYGQEVVYRYADEVGPSVIEAGLQSAVAAIQLDPAIPGAYFALGVLNLALQEHDRALSAARHAIRLDPNYADGYALLAEIAMYGGDLDEALNAIRRAKLLHPHYPFSYDWIEGHILFQMDRYDAAGPVLRAATDRNPVFLRGLIALAANLGQQGQATQAGAVLAQIDTLKPGAGWRTEIDAAPYRLDERRDRLIDGLRAAGWTE